MFGVVRRIAPFFRKDVTYLRSLYYLRFKKNGNTYHSGYVAGTVRTSDISEAMQEHIYNVLDETFIEKTKGIAKEVKNPEPAKSASNEPDLFAEEKILPEINTEAALNSYIRNALSGNTEGMNLDRNGWLSCFENATDALAAFGTRWLHYRRLYPNASVKNDATCEGYKICFDNLMSNNLNADFGSVLGKYYNNVMDELKDSDRKAVLQLSKNDEFAHVLETRFLKSIEEDKAQKLASLRQQLEDFSINFKRDLKNADLEQKHPEEFIRRIYTENTVINAIKPLIKEIELDNTHHVEENDRAFLNEKDPSLSSNRNWLARGASNGMLSKYIGSGETAVIDEFRKYSFDRIEGESSDKTYFPQMWILGKEFCKEKGLPEPVWDDIVKEDVESYLKAHGNEKTAEPPAASQGRFAFLKEPESIEFNERDGTFRFSFYDISEFQLSAIFDSVAGKEKIDELLEIGYSSNNQSYFCFDFNPKEGFCSNFVFDFKHKDGYWKPEYTGFTSGIVTNEETWKAIKDILSERVEKFEKARNIALNHTLPPEDNWQQDKKLVSEIRSLNTARRPYSSMWGSVQSCSTLAPGVYSVSTASHGGILVHSSVAEKILSEKARKLGSLENGFYSYEEDCDAAIPLVEMYKKHICEGFEWNKEKQGYFFELGQKELARYYPEYVAEFIETFGEPGIKAEEIKNKENKTMDEKEERQMTLSDFDTDRFFDVYRKQYQNFYYSEDKAVLAEQGKLAADFDRLTKTNEDFQAAVSKLCEIRKDIFSSDRECAAVIKTFSELGIGIELPLEKNVAQEAEGRKEDKKPYSFAVKTNNEYGDNEVIGVKDASEAVRLVEEMNKKSLSQGEGEPWGIAVKIPGDLVFGTDFVEDGISIVVKMEGKYDFAVMGDTFIKQLKEENERSRTYIDVYKELADAFFDQHIPAIRPDFVYEKERELFNHWDYIEAHYPDYTHASEITLSNDIAAYFEGLLLNGTVDTIEKFNDMWSMNFKDDKELRKFGQTLDDALYQAARVYDPDFKTEKNMEGMKEILLWQAQHVNLGDKVWKVEDIESMISKIEAKKDFVREESLRQKQVLDSREALLNLDALEKIQEDLKVSERTVSSGLYSEPESALLRVFQTQKTEELDADGIADLTVEKMVYYSPEVFEGWKNYLERQEHNIGKEKDGEIRAKFRLFDSYSENDTDAKHEEIIESLNKSGWDIKWNDGAEASMPEFTVSLDKTDEVKAFLKEHDVGYSESIGLLAQGYDAAWLDDPSEAEIVTEEEFKRFQELREKELKDLSLPSVKVEWTESSRSEYIKEGTVLSLKDADELLPELNSKFSDFIKASFILNLPEENIDYSLRLDLGRGYPLESLSEHIRMTCSHQEVLDAFEKNWKKVYAPSVTDEQEKEIASILEPLEKELKEAYQDRLVTFKEVKNSDSKIHSTFIIEMGASEKSRKAVEEEQEKIAGTFLDYLKKGTDAVCDYLIENKDAGNISDVEAYAKHQVKKMLQDVKYSESRGYNREFDYAIWRDSLEKVIYATDYSKAIEEESSRYMNILKEQKPELKDVSELSSREASSRSENLYGFYFEFSDDNDCADIYRSSDGDFVGSVGAGGFGYADSLDGSKTAKIPDEIFRDVTSLAERFYHAAKEESLAAEKSIDSMDSMDRIDRHDFHFYYNNNNQEYLALRYNNSEWEYAFLSSKNNFKLISRECGFSPNEPKTLEEAAKLAIETHYHLNDETDIDYDTTPADYEEKVEKAKQLDFENWVRPNSFVEHNLEKNLALDEIFRKEETLEPDKSMDMDSMDSIDIHDFIEENLPKSEKLQKAFDLRIDITAWADDLADFGTTVEDFNKWANKDFKTDAEVIAYGDELEKVLFELSDARSKGIPYNKERDLAYKVFDVNTFSELNEVIKERKETEEKFSLSLKQLYEHYAEKGGVYSMNGEDNVRTSSGRIRHTVEDGNDFYDYYDRDGNLLCMDGEVVSLTKSEDGMNYLLNVSENDKDKIGLQICLSDVELGIASMTYSAHELGVSKEEGKDEIRIERWKFNENEYPVRECHFKYEEDEIEMYVATSELNNVLLTEDGSFVSDAAKDIDSRIAYFVDDAVTLKTLSDQELLEHIAKHIDGDIYQNFPSYMEKREEQGDFIGRKFAEWASSDADDKRRLSYVIKSGGKDVASFDDSVTVSMELMTSLRNSYIAGISEGNEEIKVTLDMEPLVYERRKEELDAIGKSRDAAQPVFKMPEISLSDKDTKILPFSIIDNVEKGRVNIKFDTTENNPSFKDIIKELKAAGWKFAPSTKQWYPVGNAVSAASAFAKELQDKYFRILNEPEVSVSEQEKTAAVSDSVYDGIKFFDRNYNEPEEFAKYAGLEEKKAFAILKGLGHDFVLNSQKSDRLGLDNKNVLTAVHKEGEKVSVLKFNSLDELLDYSLENAKKEYDGISSLLKKAEGTAQFEWLRDMYDKALNNWDDTVHEISEILNERDAGKSSPVVKPVIYYRTSYSGMEFSASDKYEKSVYCRPFDQMDRSGFIIAAGRLSEQGWWQEKVLEELLTRDGWNQKSAILRTVDTLLGDRAVCRQLGIEADKTPEEKRACIDKVFNTFTQKDITKAVLGEDIPEIKAGEKTIASEAKKAEPSGLSVNEQLGPFVVNDFFNISDGVYMTTLSRPGAEKQKYFVLDRDVAEKLPADTRNLTKAEGKRYVIENKQLEPYVLRKLIAANLIPPRDELYVKNLDDYIKTHPVEFAKIELYPVTFDNFKAKVAELAQHNKALARDPLKLAQAIIPLIEKPNNDIKEEDWKKMRIKWLGNHGCDTQENMRKTFALWSQRTDRKHQKDNGYPPRGEK